MSSMKRLIAGVGALILSVGLLVGIPAALVFLAGNPIPSWDQLVLALTMPDYGGMFLVGTVIPFAAWIAWAWFAIGFLAEIPNQVRAFAAGGRRPSKRVQVPGLGLSQKGAGVLIAAMLAIAAPAGAFASTGDTAPAEATPVTVSAAATSTTPPTDAAPAPAAQAETPAAPVVTVESGDSLWAIAQQHLGDGNRWHEIFDLNKDRAQPGGITIGQRNGIDPGMTLQLPADTAAPAAVAAADTVVVQPGDTLWGIAEDQLGSGDRYMELFDASTDIVQPGGAHLTDPDLILPGWTVDVAPDVAAPAPASAPAAPTAPAAPAPVEEAAPEEAPAAPAPAAEEAPAAEGSGLGFVTSDDADDQDTKDTQPAVDEDSTDAAASDSSWLDINATWWAAGGIGGILAAGLLALLARKRRQQMRSRKIGQRIQMPDEHVAQVELAMRTVEAPHDMAAVDLALRTIAVWAQDTGSKLPPLYAMQLSEDTISLFLDAPADLPAPFEAKTEDGMAWAVGYEDLVELDRVPSAPYPALVTIGVDENGSKLLVDLERLGALNLQGGPELEHAVLTSIALELASTAWGESLQITLVGFGENLPDTIGHARLRYVDDTKTLLRNLQGRAQGITAALEAEGVGSIEEARTVRPDAESWPPEIIVLGGTATGNQVDADALAELGDLVTRIPRVGVAAIAAGHLAGGWTMHLEETAGEDGEPVVAAELEIPNSGGAVLPLTPQMVPAEYLDTVLTMFTVADNDDAIAYSAASPEISVDEIVPALAEPDPVDTASVDVDEQELPAAVTEASSAETPDLPDVDVPDVDEDVSAEDEPTPPAAADVVEAKPDVDEPVLLAPVTQLHVPRVQLLGPVKIIAPQGVTPTSETGIKQWNSVKLRATELIAYLVLHRGANTKAVHEAMWGIGSDVAKGTQSRNKLTNSARRWLGNDSEGNQYFPDALGGIYELLESVISDWDDWCALVGDEPTQAPTANLVRALQLVQGQPFSDVKDKYYGWAMDLRGTMIATIADAAHELATRALHEGNTRYARLAAAKGCAVEPENEVHWRNSLKAEHLAGNTAGIEKVIAQLEATVAKMDDLHSEFEPETQELIDQLRGRGGAQRGSLAS